MGPDDVDGIVGAWARERPGSDVEAMAVVSRVWQLAKLAGDRRRRVVAEAGADQATLDLLSVLRRSGEPYALAPGEIARRSMVTAGAISQRLTRAERDGLVERSRVPGERTRVVRLLPAGHDLVDRLVDRVAAADADLLAALDPVTRAELDRVLARVVDDVVRRDGPVAPSQVGDAGPGKDPRSTESDQAGGPHDAQRQHPRGEDAPVTPARAGRRRRARDHLEGG